MAINEFRWGMKPTIPSHWRGTLTHGGFEVEIADDWIELRKEEHEAREIQQPSAQQIVEGIVRRIGLAEKTRFTATLVSVSRFDPQYNRRDINVLLSSSIGATATCHADVIVAAADGTIVADSPRDRMSELFRVADAFSANETLRRMADYLLEYHGDPEKKLAPLFDVIELAAEAFGHEHKPPLRLDLASRG